MQTCTCCGADITWPQFHNGYAYGYTCIKKVAKGAKPSKVAFQVIDRSLMRLAAVPGTTRVNVRLDIPELGQLFGIGYNKELAEYSGGALSVVVKLLNTKNSYKIELTEDGDLWMTEKPL